MKTAAAFLSALLLAAPLGVGQESYGTIKATTKLRPDGTTSTTILDPEKGVAEETISDANGKALRKVTYVLGDRNLAVGAVFSDGKGKVAYKASYERDAVGRVVQSAFSSPDGRYLGKRTFVYGNGDTVLQMQDFDASGKLISPAQPAKSTTRRRR